MIQPDSKLLELWQALLTALTLAAGAIAWLWRQGYLRAAELRTNKLDAAQQRRDDFALLSQNMRLDIERLTADLEAERAATNELRRALSIAYSRIADLEKVVLHLQGELYVRNHGLEGATLESSIAQAVANLRGPNDKPI